MVWFCLVNNCKQYCSSNFLGLAHFFLPIMIYLCEVEGSPTLTGGEKEIGVCHNYGQNLYKCEMSGNFYHSYFGVAMTGHSIPFG